MSAVERIATQAKRWTPSVRERRRLRALFAAGLSDAEMAADMGWSPTTIGGESHPSKVAALVAALKAAP